MKSNYLVKQDLADEVLKVTALLYLEDALVKQEFEDCKELIETAKELGAEQADITDVITAYLRNPKKTRKNGTAKTRFV